MLHAAGDEPETLGAVERLDKGFDVLIGKDATLEVLADGFNWVEGSVRDKKNRQLLFSDLPGDSVYAFETPDEKPALFPGGTATRDSRQPRRAAEPRQKTYTEAEHAKRTPPPRRRTRRSGRQKTYTEAAHAERLNRWPAAPPSGPESIAPA